MRSRENLGKIKAVILDVDGVLTDGRIGYGGDGREIKFFDVQDGHGIVLAHRAGLKVGILSGRKSVANETRMAELKIDFMMEGCHGKGEGFQSLIREQGLKAEECMYIGDDIVDIPPMRLCGFAVAVANGVPELDEFCDYRTIRSGGRGAVREAIELLLKEQGKWQDVVQRYYC